ncbi:Putative L-valine exporter [Citrobacter freundii]
MSYEVLLLGLLVGCVNYCFRYLPLRLGVGNVRPTKPARRAYYSTLLALHQFAPCWWCLPRQK